MDELADLRTLLASPLTGIRLVLTPERVVAAETRRTLTALALLGLRVDGLVVNRMLPVPPADAAGEAARWLRERATEQAAVLADVAGLGLPCAPSGTPRPSRRASAHCSRLAADLWGDDDPAAEPGRRRPRCWPCAGPRAPAARADAEFELALHLPGAAPRRWTWRGSATSWRSPWPGYAAWWRCPRCCGGAR